MFLKCFQYPPPDPVTQSVQELGRGEKYLWQYYKGVTLSSDIMVLIQMLSDRDKDYLAEKMKAMEKPGGSNSAYSGILSRYEGRR